MNAKILTTVIIGLLLIATLFAGCSSQTAPSSVENDAASAGQNTANTASNSADADLALVTQEDTQIGEMI